MRRRSTRWLVVTAFACLGLGLLMGTAGAQEEGGTTMQGTQSSNDSSATTGETSGDNTANFNGGPSASGDDASSSQVGNNSANVSQSGTAKSGDPVAGSQVTGAVGPNVTVQNQNSATDPSAVSGATSLTNNLGTQMGPQASGTDTAQAAQTGSNSVTSDQSSVISSGDAVAGSQVTGIVGPGEHIIQNQNASTCDVFLDDSCAISGDTEVTNSTEFLAGPSADADNLAQASQIGDNDAVLTQSTTAQSGDALFGSQVAGVVGGSATVQQQNSSEVVGGRLPAAVSGSLTVNNFAVAAAGPAASSERTAQASQTGDNTADISQRVGASSGDALSGSQVTGGVGDQGGYFVVQNQQASEDDHSVSGDTAVINGAYAVAGPTALALPDPAEEEEELLPAEAQASQIGDNALTFTVATEIGSGDSLAGAQVTGAVGYSDVTVQNQNSAEAPIAFSGAALVDNEVIVVAGPLAHVFGEVEVVFNNVTIDASSSDTPAGTEQGENQEFTAVGAFGNMTAQASQTGDNSVSGAIGVQIGSGDAVAGGQVTGVVASGSDVTVQNQNSSEEAFAETGATTVLNEVDVTAGPFALNEASARVELNNVTIDASATASAAADEDRLAIGGFVTIVAIAEVEDQTAQASQTGDNSVDVAMGVEVGSGDAVAGGQVTGVVAGDGADVTIQNQNASEDSDAFSGNTTVTNEVTASAGPVARNEASAEVDINNVTIDASADAHAAAGATATAIGGIVSITAFAGVDDQEAQASQIGDNSVAAAIGVEIGSGDAVAGAQVTGVVTGAGSDVVIQNQNSDEGSSATSGATGVTNSVDVQAGPRAENLAEVEYDINNVTIDVSATATSAAAAAATAIGGIVAFNLDAAVDDQTAQASQTGDNSVDVAAAVVVASGDAVSGSQVTGVVSGDGSDITVQEQNSAEGSAALTGDTTVANAVTVAAGPVASNEAAVDAEINNVTIDASAFAHAAADPEDAESFLEDGEGAIATAIGGIVSFNFTGAVGDQDAQASQVGDNSIAAATGVDISSGDAVAGGQVTGVVAGDGSDVTVQNQNSASETDATTGAVTAANNVAIAAGPVASNDAAVDIEFNNTVIDVSANAGAAANATAFALGGIVVFTAEGAAGNQTAQAAQTGDNLVDASAAVVVASGDAVSGSQVAGVVAGDASDVTIQNQNASDLASATSGGVTADNNVDVIAGPRADNRADVNVDFGNVTVTATETEVGPGDTTAVAGIVVFVDVENEAEGQDAQASQIGDNIAVVDTSVSASSGDAVAGSQVTGVVAGEGSEVTIQNQNVSTEADAVSGAVDATNTMTVALGPAATNLGETEEDTVAQASQVGDNVLDFTQDISVASGDAVGGSQVTGVVGATDAVVQVSGSDDGSIAVSGLTSAINFAEGSLTASASGDTAHASQRGDSAVSGSQSLSTDSGDAVAGSQVAGNVGDGS